MQCPHCGEGVPDNSRFCTFCGSEQARAKQPESVRIGFSPKINDPAFARYLKQANRYSFMFTVFLALAAVIGFFIYGENSYEMDNPQALFIGLGIGAMFISMALLQIWGRKRSKTWDGTVIDKRINRKRRKKHTGDNDYYWVNYTEYAVVIRDDGGKEHFLTAEDDDTCYNYYQIGDRVRHHGGLNSYEKYDKSGDSIIFCSACASLCDINDDYCFRCQCPLLK
jgi:hypothetical protein